MCCNLLVSIFILKIVEISIETESPHTKNQLLNLTSFLNEKMETNKILRNRNPEVSAKLSHIWV